MGEVGSVPVFGRIPCAVIGSPAGRGNQVWIVAGDAGTMRWVALRERWIAASG